MAYCRFSDDSFRSDIYCYESEEGFVVNVADTRYFFSEPVPDLPEDFWNLSPEEINRHFVLMREIIERSKKEPILLPDAGATFVFDDHQSAIDKLVKLRNSGFRVPKIAIVRLLVEISHLKTVGTEC